MTTIATSLGVARSHLHDRLHGAEEPYPKPHKAKDAAVLQSIQRRVAERPRRTHDGKVTVMRSNLRWCSGALEFTCWSGEVVRMAFAIDRRPRS